MQIRSFRGSGEPARVNALPSARFCLGPDPRRALGPAASPAASTGRTRDRTRPILQLRQKVLARAPSTRDPNQTWWVAHSITSSAAPREAWDGHPESPPAQGRVCRPHRLEKCPKGSNSHRFMRSPPHHSVVLLVNRTTDLEAIRTLALVVVQRASTYSGRDALARPRAQADCVQLN